MVILNANLLPLPLAIITEGTKLKVKRVTTLLVTHNTMDSAYVSPLSDCFHFTIFQSPLVVVSAVYFHYVRVSLFILSTEKIIVIALILEISTFCSCSPQANTDKNY